MNYFVLDESVNSRADLGLRITEPPALPASKRIVHSIEVDGREGTLTIMKGWEDIPFEMKAALIGQNLRARWRNVLSEVLSAQMLYFSADPDVYYRVKYVSTGELVMKLSQLCEFSLTFTCAPFRYKRNVSMVTLTASGSVTNPGTVYSLPRIKVYGTGSRTLTINGKPIILNILSGSLTLDSERKECFYGDTAQNNRMTGDFPVFNVGSNQVTLGSGITKVEIEPRWRYI
jgi:phage-related protein